MNSDFTSKDTSRPDGLNGVNKVLSRLKLCIDSSVIGFSTLVKYLDSW